MRWRTRRLIVHFAVGQPGLRDARKMPPPLRQCPRLVWKGQLQPQRVSPYLALVRVGEFRESDVVAVSAFRATSATVDFAARCSSSGRMASKSVG